jgi:FkbM family methyltransferase
MDNTNILNLGWNRIRSFFVLIKEGYTFKDKITILSYYLKSPLHLINYIRGIKNSRKLSRGVYLKNRFGVFYCGDNYSSVFGCSTICEPIMSKYVVLEKGIAVDLGSNCGMFTIPLARSLGKNGRVISVEPDKKNIALLKNNLVLNKLTNVSVVEKGCFSKKGEMTFYLDDIGAGGHSLLEHGITKKEIIKVDTLDNILKNLKIKKVDLIKMDVMGVELETLKGAKQVLKKSHPKIVFELLHKEDKDKVYEFLYRYNYKIKQITTWNHIAI